MPAIGLRTNRAAQAAERERLLPYYLNTYCLCGASGCSHLIPNKYGESCDVFMTDPKRMQLDHSTPVALGGGGVPGDRIICAHCNQSAGATLGNQLRGNRASRDWHA